jgi:hypothetical protein
MKATITIRAVLAPHLLSAPYSSLLATVDIVEEHHDGAFRKGLAGHITLRHGATESCEIPLDVMGHSEVCITAYLRTEPKYPLIFRANPGHMHPSISRDEPERSCSWCGSSSCPHVDGASCAAGSASGQSLAEVGYAAQLRFRIPGSCATLVQTREPGESIYFAVEVE